MIKINERTKTAGAYVLYNGYFLFMVGYSKDRDHRVLGVVRFGGHRENNEPLIQCAAREIKEESMLDIRFFDSPSTYIIKDDTYETYNIKCENETINPILIRQGDDGYLSLMYLAYGHGLLRPNMETQGILMLRREDVFNICTNSITLKEYKESGGMLITKEALPNDAVLSPAVQLRFLHKLFIINPDLLTSFINASDMQ